MAIQIRSAGQAAARLPGTRAPQVTAGPVDFRNTQSMQIGRDLSQAFMSLGKTAQDQIRKDQEAQQATDLLNATNDYADATAKFEDSFYTSVKGKDARDTAGESFADFHKNEIENRAQQFSGNPQLKNTFLTMANSTRRSSINRGLTYGRAEDLSYRTSTDKANAARMMSVVASSSDADAMKALDLYAAEHASMFPNDHGAVDSKGNKIEPAAIINARSEVVGTLINRAIAEKDYDRAENLLKGNKAVLGANIDEFTARVSGARIVGKKEEGTAYANDLYNKGVEPSEAWETIGKIKDANERSAAMSQYSSMQTMKMKIETEDYQNAIPVIRQDIDTIVATDIGAAEAHVLAMPESGPLDRKKKEWARKYVNQWKASEGIQPLTDSTSYLGLQADILGGNINTPEAIRADPRAARVTGKDLEDDLVNLLDQTQKTTDREIQDAFRQSMGAKKFDNIKKNNPDKYFNMLKQAKNMVKITNRGQDTGYIQDVADSLVLKGFEAPDNQAEKMIDGIRSFFGGGETLADELDAGNFSLSELKTGLVRGESPWLPSSVPDTFQAIWNDPGQITPQSKAAFTKMYGSDAVKAGYAVWQLNKINKRQ